MPIHNSGKEGHSSQQQSDLNSENLSPSIKNLSISSITSIASTFSKPAAVTTNTTTTTDNTKSIADNTKSTVSSPLKNVMSSPSTPPITNTNIATTENTTDKVVKTDKTTNGTSSINQTGKMASIDPIDQYSAKPIKTQQSDAFENNNDKSSSKIAHNNANTKNIENNDVDELPLIQNSNLFADSSTIQSSLPDNKIPQTQPGTVLEDIPEHVLENIPEHVLEHVLENIPESCLIPNDNSAKLSKCSSVSSSSEIELLPDDLQDASKQSENVVLELALDGTIRYLSSSWEDITGYPAADLINSNISQIIIGESNDREVFVKAAEAMTSDESSYRIRFLTSKRPLEAAQLFMNMDASIPDTFDDIENYGMKSRNISGGKFIDASDTQSITSSCNRKYSTFFRKQVDAVAEAAAIALSPAPSSTDLTNLDRFASFSFSSSKNNSNSNQQLLIPAPTDQQIVDRRAVPRLSSASANDPCVSLSSSFFTTNVNTTDANATSSNNFKVSSTSTSNYLPSSSGNDIKPKSSASSSFSSISEQNCQQLQTNSDTNHNDQKSVNNKELPLKANANRLNVGDGGFEHDKNGSFSSLHNSNAAISDDDDSEDGAEDNNDDHTHTSAPPFGLDKSRINDTSSVHQFPTKGYENAIEEEECDELQNIDENNDIIDDFIEIEAQGVLMYNKITGKPSHTMWVLRPYTSPKPINVELSENLIEALGFGVDLLVDYLETITNLVLNGSNSSNTCADDDNTVNNSDIIPGKRSDSSNSAFMGDGMLYSQSLLPPPPVALCRICEHQFPTWWFERHSSLCLVEHKAQSDIETAHENLLDQRNTISQLLTLMDHQFMLAASGVSNSLSNSILMSNTFPSTELSTKASDNQAPNSGSSNAVGSSSLTVMKNNSFVSLSSMQNQQPQPFQQPALHSALSSSSSLVSMASNVSSTSTLKKIEYRGFQLPISSEIFASASPSASSPQPGLTYPTLDRTGSSVSLSSFQAHSPVILPSVISSNPAFAVAATASPPHSPRMVPSPTPSSSSKSRMMMGKHQQVMLNKQNRQPIKLMELLLSLCDMAVQINSPEIRYFFDNDESTSADTKNTETSGTGMTRYVDYNSTLSSSSGSATTTTKTAGIETVSGQDSAASTSSSTKEASPDSTDPIQATPERAPTKMRIHSPNSESNIYRVLKWSPPNIDDPGLRLLCQDTEKYAHEKVSAVLRLGNTIKYSDTIRKEVENMVFDVVQETINKAIQGKLALDDLVVEDCNTDEPELNTELGKMEQILEVPENPADAKDHLQSATTATSTYSLFDDDNETDAISVASLDQRSGGRNSDSSSLSLASRRDSRISQTINSNNNRHGSNGSRSSIDRAYATAPSSLRNSVHYYGDESDMEKSSLFSDSYLHRDDIPLSKASSTCSKDSTGQQSGPRTRSNSDISVRSVKSQHSHSLKTPRTLVAKRAIGPKDITTGDDIASDPKDVSNKLSSNELQCQNPLELDCPPHSRPTPSSSLSLNDSSFSSSDPCSSQVLLTPKALLTSPTSNSILNPSRSFVAESKTSESVPDSDDLLNSPLEELEFPSAIKSQSNSNNNSTSQSSPTSSFSTPQNIPIRNRAHKASNASQTSYTSSFTSLQRNRVPANPSSENVQSPSTPLSSPVLFPYDSNQESGSGPSNLNHFHLSRRQSSAIHLTDLSRPPVSPLLTSSVPPPSRPSILDYDLINPISRGAFGSVFLARKRLTGEYFAIKALKKADMIAKNQVTNVRAERAIMMSQAESPFVAKLYFTFQNKNYLFLVMEYLNGGDCAALVKALGGLPEEWAKKYCAEVVVGVQDLHKKRIVHRDLKPDNLLIDKNGHLKLTDFGLSRMGLVGRHTRTGNNNSNSNENTNTDTSNANGTQTPPSGYTGVGDASSIMPQASVAGPSSLALALSTAAANGSVTLGTSSSGATALGAMPKPEPRPLSKSKIAPETTAATVSSVAGALKSSSTNNPSSLPGASLSFSAANLYTPSILQDPSISLAQGYFNLSSGSGASSVFGGTGNSLMLNPSLKFRPGMSRTESGSSATGEALFIGSMIFGDNRVVQDDEKDNTFLTSSGSHHTGNISNTTAINQGVSGQLASSFGSTASIALANALRKDPGAESVGSTSGELSQSPSNTSSNGVNATSDTPPTSSSTSLNPLARPSTNYNTLSITPDNVKTPPPQQPFAGASNSPKPLALFDPTGPTFKFVGTPDYLAPETIRGVGQDEMSDWWSLGCILFEFLYGYPPFHAESPEEVFRNILDHNWQWPTEEEEEECNLDISPEAKDLIKKLLNPDPNQRLGAKNGAHEIKQHPFFNGINWDTLWDEAASFIPATDDPESTDYFDPRGAEEQAMPEDMIQQDEDEEMNNPIPQNRGTSHTVTSSVSDTSSSGHSSRAGSFESTNFTFPYRDGLQPQLPNHPSQSQKPKQAYPLSIPPHIRDSSRSRRLSETNIDGFGSFSYKNLPVLDKANKDTWDKLKSDSIEHRNSIVDGCGIRGRGLSISTAPPKRPNSPSVSNVGTSNRVPSPVRQTTNPSPFSLQTSLSMHSPVSSSSTALFSSSPSTATSPSISSFSSHRKVYPTNVPTHNHHRPSISSISTSSINFLPSSPKSSYTVSSSPAGSNDLPLSHPMSIPMPLSNLSSHSSKLSTPASPHAQYSTNSPLSTSATSTSSSSSMLYTPSAVNREASPEVLFNESFNHHIRRNSSIRYAQTLDPSPSSSDNEENAFKRVQKRRQLSSRTHTLHKSQVPAFRKLDVLVCDDNPVMLYTMKVFLQQLGCNVATAPSTSEGIRVATGKIEYDIIFTEYKFGTGDNSCGGGAEIVRVVRNIACKNTSTPVVVITAYSKEAITQPKQFSSIVEKPPTLEKFIKALEMHCCWKPKSAVSLVAAAHLASSVNNRFGKYAVNSLTNNSGNRELKHVRSGSVSSSAVTSASSSATTSAANSAGTSASNSKRGSMAVLAGADNTSSGNSISFPSSGGQSSQSSSLSKAIESKDDNETATDNPYSEKQSQSSPRWPSPVPWTPVSQSSQQQTERSAFSSSSNISSSSNRTTLMRRPSTSVSNPLGIIKKRNSSAGSLNSVSSASSSISSVGSVIIGGHSHSNSGGRSAGGTNSSGSDNKSSGASISGNLPASSSNSGTETLDSNNSSPSISTTTSTNTHVHSNHAPPLRKIVQSNDVYQDVPIVLPRQRARSGSTNYNNSAPSYNSPLSSSVIINSSSETSFDPNSPKNPSPLSTIERLASSSSSSLPYLSTATPKADSKESYSSSKD